MHQTAGELVDRGCCGSQKHGCSIAQHHWGAFIALSTKRSKGTPGEMSTLLVCSLCFYWTAFGWLLPKTQSRAKSILPDCNRCCDLNDGMKIFSLLAWVEANELDQLSLQMGLNWNWEGAECLFRATAAIYGWMSCPHDSMNQSHGFRQSPLNDICIWSLMVEKPPAVLQE